MQCTYTICRNIPGPRCRQGFSCVRIRALGRAPERIIFPRNGASECIRRRHLIAESIVDEVCHSAIGLFDFAYLAQCIERPRRRRAARIRGGVQRVERAVGVAGFALRRVRHHDGPSEGIDLGDGMLKQRIRRIDNKTLVARRGRGVPWRRMANFAPDGVEFVRIEKQIGVGCSFRGRDRTFRRFPAQSIVPENLHVPRRFLTCRCRAMRKRTNGPTQAVESRFVVGAARRRDSIGQSPNAVHHRARERRGRLRSMRERRESGCSSKNACFRALGLDTKGGGIGEASYSRTPALSSSRIF